mgnify:FL=1
MLAHNFLLRIDMTFIIDERITSSCFKIADWSLSTVFLKNNANYPWFILVPRYDNLQEIDQLPIALQHTLIEEISALSRLVKNEFKPDKINMGTLGNIVPQLHIHVVGRFKNDALWPHSVWQDAQETRVYEKEALDHLLNKLSN